MNSNRVIATVLSVAALLAGCSKSYEHRRLADQDPRADEVCRMVHALRQSSDPGLLVAIREQAAPDLAPALARKLEAALLDLARADSADLLRVDAFGGRTLRSSFRLVRRGQTDETALLLLIDSGGRLRWTGPNG